MGKPETMREYCNNNPLVAIKAAIDGLLTYNKLNWFRFQTTTFGLTNGITCYGCVATLAVIKLTKVKGNKCVTDEYSNRGGRSRIHKLPAKDLRYFEEAIDDLRLGDISSLNFYFDSNLPDLPEIKIENNNVVEEIHRLIHYYNDNSVNEYVFPHNCSKEIKIAVKNNLQRLDVY